jgi:formylglycine-generating enzyme required for sulfatase activity
MSLPGVLCQVGLKYLFDVTSREVGEWVDSRFEDSSRAVVRAVFEANRRTWDVIGLALTERTFAGRARDLLREADAKAARDELRALVAAIPVEQRARAAAELDALSDRHRNAATDALAGAEGAFRRFGDPAGVVGEADRAASELPDTIAADAPNLVAVLRLTPDGRTHLFLALFRYHFRKLAAKNTELSALLQHDKLRALGEQTDARTAGILDQCDALFERLDAGFTEVNAKLDDIDAKLDKLLDERNVSTSARDPLKVSVTSERELAALRRWRDELRALSPEQVSSALQSKLGDALAAARMFAEAREAHEAAARAATDQATRAEAEFKVYRDACEQEAWSAALPALRRAAELDPNRFSPFPFNRYEPVEILGAGGFGTVMRCRQKLAKGREVAVKAFHPADLGRELGDVFAEAHTLSELVDPAIVKIIDWEFADPSETRPYLVMEYFPGISLAAWLKREGRLPVADFVTVARQVAAAMTVAHAANVLHRDLKPGNILIRRLDGGGLDARVIDFGLAVRLSAAQASVSTSAPHRTRRDLSFAGSLEYASPEQKQGGALNPRSDVYSYGKTMLEALLGTAEPTSRSWKTVPDEYRGALQGLLELCVEKDPAERHAGFDVIAKALAAIDPAEKVTRERLEREAAERKRHAEEAEWAWLQTVADGGRMLEEGKRQEAERKKREEEEARRKAEEEAKAKNPFLSDRTRLPGEKVTLQLPGDVSMGFAWCPPGSFRMGSVRGDSDEEPVHKVTLSKGFFMGIHPVTQAQWKAMMGTNPSHFKGVNRPVESVSWDDCREFCEKITAVLKGRVTVRLPTEAEWEYACRAGTKTGYWSGNDDAALDRVGWYSANCSETQPVGQLAPNAWGLFDVHGNVWEWCSDWFGPYSANEQTDPIGQSSGDSRVLRGGSWYYGSGHCRAAYRFRNVPQLRYNIGFRVCFRLD